MKDWVVLVRPLANLPRHAAYDILEGIIDTDWWLGPLVFPLQMRKTDQVIQIRKDKPIVQVQPIHRTCLTDATLANPEVMEVRDWGNNEWSRFQASMELKAGARHPGSYRHRAREELRQFSRGSG
jgi:hypothetical protein